MQRFEICDFVRKKVCIKWECASSGDLLRTLRDNELGANFCYLGELRVPRTEVEVRPWCA